jgi:hypothetical protein
LYCFYWSRNPASLHEGGEMQSDCSQKSAVVHWRVQELCQYRKCYHVTCFPFLADYIGPDILSTWHSLSQNWRRNASWNSS